MKCPKCSYISFDYNRECPKCGNDITEELNRLNFKPVKPSPPFFLASLIGTGEGTGLKIPSNGMDFSDGGDMPGEVGADDVLMTLDEMSNQENETDVSLSQLEPEDEISFEMNPEMEDAFETDGLERLENESLGEGLTDDSPEKGMGAVTPDEPEEESDILFLDEEEVDEGESPNLFLDEEPESLEIPVEKQEPGAAEEALQAEGEGELLLSLDDLSEGETTQEPLPVEKTNKDDAEDVIQMDGFWDSDAEDSGEDAFSLEETPKKDPMDFSAEPSGKKGGEDEIMELELEPLDLELSSEETVEDVLEISDVKEKS